jgi:arylsulfatase
MKSPFGKRLSVAFDGDYVFCSAALASLLLVALDSVRAHRSNFWTGDSIVQMGAPIVPFVVYALFVFIFSRLVVWVMSRRFAAFAVWGIATLLAMMLVQVSADFSSKMAVAYSFCLAAITLFLVLLDKFTALSYRLGAIISIFSLFVVWPAMHATGHAYYIDAARHTMVTLLPGIWVLIAATVMFALAIHSPPKAFKRITMCFLMLAAAPLLTLKLVGSSRVLAISEEPSLIFVTFDALRADYCSVYGGTAATPNFERVANEGLVFEQAYALAPWTLPSVNSLYSSTYPYGLTPGAPWEQWRREVTGYSFDTHQETLAQRLQAKGYATALLTGNALLGQHESIRRGFDTFFRLGPDVSGLTGRWAYVPCFRQVLEVIAPSIADSQPVDTTAVLTAYAQAFIREHRGQPIFMWLHYLDPHDPYDPPESFRTRAGPWDVFPPHPSPADTTIHKTGNALTLTADETAYVRSLYEAEIRYVDEAFGKVLDTTFETGHGANAVVALSADHGEEFWDHGKWGHGHSLHNEVIRVPLIIAAPQLGPGKVTKPFSHIDLIPTFADLLDAGQDPIWQGQSQFAKMNESSGSSEQAVFTRATHLVNPDEPLEMAIAEPFKLIVGLESSTALLYNLQDDPNEQVNLAQQDEAAVSSLYRQLHAWRDAVPSTYDELNADQAVSINEDVLEIMESLGYLD